MKEMI